MNCVDPPGFDMLQTVLAFHQLIISAIVVTCFVATKSLYDNFRRRHAKMTVVVVGAGPIGLTSLFVAAHSGRVSRILLFEELCKKVLVNKPHQIALDPKSVAFLRGFGVDFDNIEGCWDSGCFFTRLGVFEEYLLSTIQRLPVPVDVRLGSKFTRESLRDLETIDGRKLVIACDGANGQSIRHLGLTDQYVQHSCKSYGAVAAIERPQECPIPMQERRQHNLHFDLRAYGATEEFEADGHPGFSLKIFGTSRHRYMTLVIPKCESALVKALRVVLDRSMMRNIFVKCFNTYKSDAETSLSDSMAVKHMKFSPRLFEIKLSQRLETVAYFQDTDTLVTAEGEAARCYNIHTGLDVNVGLKGLQSLPEFLDRAAVCDSEHSMESTLAFKSQSADSVCKDFVKNGLWEHMIS